jgi:hypothetical protein
MAQQYVNSYNALSGEVNDNYKEVFTGYLIPPSKLGTTTSPQAFNQVAEVTARLNEGMSVIEVQPLGQGVMEGIPKQHFKEMNQLSKLTGSEISLHAPVVDLTGFTKEGWSEAARQQAERQLIGIVGKGHELNDKGNVPITIHASPGIPAYEWKIPEGKNKPEVSSVTIVFQETGQPMQITDIERNYPGKGKMPFSEQEVLKEQNKERWSKQLMGLEYYKRVADQEVGQVNEIFSPSSRYSQELGILDTKERSGIELTEQELNQKRNYGEMKKRSLNDAWNHLKYTDNELREVFNLAVKFDKANQGALTETSNRYKEFVDVVEEIDGKKARGEEISDSEWQKALKIGNRATSDVLDVLHKSKPQLFVPVEDFAKKKSAETIANVAFDACVTKKWGDKAPILSLENVYPDWTFSRADKLKELVQDSRKQFVEKAVRAGMKREVAENTAEKVIGVTWDVAHINMLKKFGYTDKEMIEETKKIAPFVKHAHISDNFGFEDSHLPTGMGTVPTKELIEKLKQEGGFKGKVISEAGGQFVQQFRASPNPYVMEALGNPIYAAAGPGMRQGSYFSGYGVFLPEQNFSMYGGGFSSLPTELGGQIPGRQSRLSGTPVD